MKGKMIIHDCIIDVEFDSMPKYKLGVSEISDENGQKSFTINKDTSGWLPFEFDVKEKTPEFTAYYSGRQSVYLICEKGIVQFYNAYDKQKYEEDDAIRYELMFDKCQLR